MALNYTANTFKLYLGRRRSPQPKRQKSTQNFNQFVTYTQLDNILDKIWEELNELDGAVGTSGTLEASALRTLSGTTQGDTDLGTFTGATISDNTTTKTALQELETSLETKAASATVTEIDANVDDLITLSGVAENTTDLGTFSGTTITDNIAIKAALQELETAVESAGGGTFPNVYFVDLVNGNDGTGAVGDISKPYLTGQQAIDDADGSGNKCLVMYLNYSGDYSATEDITLKGDVSVTTFHAIELPIPRVFESFTQITQVTNWFGGTSQYVDEWGQGDRLYIGDITVGSTWTVGNEVSHINCDNIIVEQDMATVTSGIREDSSNQYKFFDIYVNTNISLTEGSSLTVYGTWEKIYVKGNCLNTTTGAGTIVGGHWNYCAVKGYAWNAETVTGIYNYCYVQTGGWAQGGDDFIGHAYRCWADAGVQGVFGANSGDMQGHLEDCVVVGTAGLTDAAAISGSVRGGYFRALTVNSSTGVTGLMENVHFYSGYLYLLGTMRHSYFNYDGTQYGKLGTASVMIGCEIDLAAARGFGATLKTCAGVVKDCIIRQATSSLYAPFNVEGSGVGTELILDNVTIVTDGNHAVVAYSAGQHILAMDVKSNAATAVIDAATNSPTVESNNVYQTTKALR